jgi:hypothetical protein
MESSDENMMPGSNRQDAGKRPTGRAPRRLPGLLWIIATTRGRRVALGVLLAMLVGIGALLVYRQGWFGTPQTTMTVWLAFGFVLVLIFVVALLEMMVIRVKFKAAQRDLARHAIAEAQQLQQLENGLQPDNPRDTSTRGGQTT